MKAIASFVLSFMFFTISAYASDDVKDLRKYVEDLIDEGYKIVNDGSLTESQKHKKSSEMIKSHLHLDWMANYTLGRNRKIIPSEKIAEFTETYSKFIIKVYADLFSNYNGEKAVLKNIRQLDSDMFIVNTEIILPSDQQPLKVDYLIHKLEGDIKNPYRIGDIITEGVSVLNSQQSEFSNVISTRGIDDLIADLKKRIQQPKETNLMQDSQ